MKKNAQSSAGRVQRLEAACRERGIPVTVQRRVILAALLDHRDHPTVDQIYADVKSRIPEVSRTTVYRSLETLADLGLARRTNHFAAFARFDGNLEQHHHLVCVRCGEVADFEQPDVTLAELPDLSASGFHVQDYSIYFEGLCAHCKPSTGSTRGDHESDSRRAPAASQPRLLRRKSQ